MFRLLAAGDILPASARRRIVGVGSWKRTFRVGVLFFFGGVSWQAPLSNVV
jgi:hypothetical protein